jgi:hypothetical protein
VGGLLTISNSFTVAAGASLLNLVWRPTFLYRNFFQREPDQGGMNFWQGQLAAGV